MTLDEAYTIVAQFSEGGRAYRLAYPDGGNHWILDDRFTADQLEAIAIVMRSPEPSEKGLDRP